MRADFSIKRLVAVLAVAIPCALGGAAAAADGYTVVELGALRQNGSSVGRHMDSTGTRVVGSSGLIHGSDTRAFVWSASTGMRDLGTFQGGDYSEAFGVNDSGSVVGDSNTRENIRAFVWNAQEGMRELSPLPGDVASRAFAINNSGQVVGYSSGKNGVRAVIWSAKLEVRSLGDTPRRELQRSLCHQQCRAGSGDVEGAVGSSSLSVDQPRGHGRSRDTAGKRLL